MLFINEDPRHVVVRSAVKPLFDTKGNQIKPAERRLYAKFQRGSAPSWAQQLGIETFAMLNRPPEVEAGAWLSAYDSEADEWNPDERKVVEARLIELGYMQVERPRLVAPYPMFDKHRKTAGKRTVEHAINDITAAYETAGFNIEAAVAYERENGNDQRVIDALYALAASDGVEEEAEPLIAA